MSLPGGLTMLDGALWYAEHGWRVFPVEERGKRPLTEHGLHDATADAESIREWWREWPEANIGAATGGLLVVDADNRAGPDGRTGDESWRELVAAHGGHARTREQRTGGGGLQVFFADPERGFGNTASRIAPNIDTRAEGGYVVLPPSLHASGERYRWLAKLPPAHMPGWLAELLTPPAPWAPVGERRSLLWGNVATGYGEAALQGIAEEMRRTPEGARNQTLVALAFRAGRLAEAGEIEPTTAEEAIVAAAREAGLSELEARRTFRSGVTAGMAAGPAKRSSQTGVVGAGWAHSARPESSYDKDDRNDQTPIRLARERGLVVPVVSVVHLLPPRPAAYHGLAGRVVRAIEPHSEADPVAVLGSFLAAFGSACNRAPHVMVGRVRHGTNLQLVNVGDSSKARKGTSWADVRFLLGMADEDWGQTRVVNGLVSGEGVIHHVRDPVMKTDEQGDAKIIDAGVSDKRLMCVESEYGRVLAAGGRDGSTLLHVLRAGWDGDRLGNLTKKDAETATGAHISVLGHITLAELQRLLTETDRANGFANRVVWLYVRRSKELPFGGELPPGEAEQLGHELRRALDHARQADRVEWSESGRAAWERHYSHLSRERPGLTGAILSRAEAQVLRLALLYALLDCSAEIRAEHVEAALALWDYSERSVGLIFDGVIGDPIADSILAALRHAGASGLTRTAIRDLFQRNANAANVTRALVVLEREGLARSEKAETGEAGGRPAELWFPVAATETTETTEPPAGTAQNGHLNHDLERLADHPSQTLPTRSPCGDPAHEESWQARDGRWRCSACEPPTFPGEVVVQHDLRGD